MRLLEEQVDGIGEVGDWASEGQAARVYGAGFTARSLAGKGARGGTRGMEDKVSIGKELMGLGGWRKVTEGSKEEGCEWRDQIRGCDDFL